LPSLSRVADRVHHVGDVLVGAAVGVAAAAWAAGLTDQALTEDGSSGGGTGGRGEALGESCLPLESTAANKSAMTTTDEERQCGNGGLRGSGFQ